MPECLQVTISLYLFVCYRTPVNNFAVAHYFTGWQLFLLDMAKYTIISIILVDFVPIYKGIHPILKNFQVRYGDVGSLPLGNFAQVLQPFNLESSPKPTNLTSKPCNLPNRLVNPVICGQTARSYIPMVGVCSLINTSPHVLQIQCHFQSPLPGHLLACLRFITLSNIWSTVHGGRWPLQLVRGY